MEIQARWNEKPLSFCLFTLYILTPDAPTPNVRSWNIPKHSKASLPEEILLRFSSLFSANDRKLDWTLGVKLEPRTFLYDICHYIIIFRTQSCTAYLFISFIQSFVSLIVWLLTGLFKKGTLQFNVVVLLLNIALLCLTTESHCC